MDLRQLRYFLEIVQCGSVAKAADELHVAQSAISHHLNRLERELGCALVHRTSRGILPTESGFRLAERAKFVLSEVESIAEDVRGIGAAPAGDVVVGLPTSLGLSMSVPLALTVREQYPQIRLRIVEGLSGHMFQWLVSGQLHLAVVFGNGNASGIEKAWLGKEHLNLVGALTKEAVSGLSDIPPLAILKLPLVLPSRPHGLREEVERAASRYGHQPNIIMEIDSLQSIKALVAEGVGYTVLSARAAESGTVSTRLQYRPIGQPRIERSIYLARSSQTPPSMASNCIAKVISDIFASGHLSSNSIRM